MKHHVLLTPYQRIMRAAKAGNGVRLSADEVWKLSFDDAIATRATNDDYPLAEGDALGRTPVQESTNG